MNINMNNLYLLLGKIDYKDADYSVSLKNITFFI